MDGYLAKPVQRRRLLEAAERFASSRTNQSTLRNGATRVVDLSELDELVQGDTDILRRVIDVFLEEMPEVVPQIRDAIRSFDCEMVERAAHRLKGSLLAVGARVLATKAACIEDAARERQLAELERAWTFLEDDLPTISQQLREVLQRRAVT